MKWVTFKVIRVKSNKYHELWRQVEKKKRNKEGNESHKQLKMFKQSALIEGNYIKSNNFRQMINNGKAF